MTDRPESQNAPAPRRATAETGSTVGVQELIDQLKHEGVNRGQQEAEQLITEARRESTRLIEQAREQASRIIEEARDEAEQLRRNGEQALRLAGRDASLKLREQLQDEFKSRLGQLVGRTLRDDRLVRQLVLEIAAAAVPAGRDQRASEGGAESVASGGAGADDQPGDDQPGDDQPGDDPRRGGERMQILVSGGSDPEANERLSELVRDLSADMLSESVRLEVDRQTEAGVRVRLLDRDVEVDLSEEAISRLLMRFLAPRFRAIVDAPG